ncbi:MAG: anion transporter [Candidatus Binataceae bacterium]
MHPRITLTSLTQLSNSHTGVTSIPMILPLAIFAATYFVIATGKLPYLKLDRTGAALAGAVAMVAAGVLSRREALAAIDFRTLALLLGMMIVVANLRLSGAFAKAARGLLLRAHSGFGLLAMTIAAAGILAAFFINDVVCLALAPLLLDVSRTLEVSPLPYLIALATAANIGSTATITGNPQNMIVAGFAHLSYGAFATRLAPLAAAGLVVNYAIVAALYRKQLRGVRLERANAAALRIRVPRVYLIRSTLIAIGVLGGFIAGLPTDLVAIAAGAVSLFTRRIKPARVYKLVDWTLLLMFAGLFIVVAGAEHTGVQDRIVAAIGSQRLLNIAVLTAVTAILSNIVSNVPAVMLFQPLYRSYNWNRRTALVIASASTLAGNLTILGSIANLIVVEAARREQITISFGEYMRTGVPLTVITLAIEIAMLHGGI